MIKFLSIFQRKNKCFNKKTPITSTVLFRGLSASSPKYISEADVENLDTFDHQTTLTADLNE